MNAAAPLFSGKLYLRTMRRLWGNGVAWMVLSLGLLLLNMAPYLPLGNVDLVAWGTRSIPFVHIGGHLYILPFLVPVTLMLHAFYFQFRRAGSDFYHGLPCSRLCLGITVTAAALTWFFAVLLVTLAACAVLLPLTAMITPPPVALLWMLAYHGTCGLLVTACLLVGLCSAGTPVASLALAGIVLFLPRAVLTAYRSVYVLSSGLMVYNDAGAYLSPTMHLPTASVLVLLQNDELSRIAGALPEELLSYVPGILYSLGWAIVMMIVGLWRCVQRPAEIAGRDFVRPFPRYGLRAAGALVPLLAVAYLLALQYQQAPFDSHKDLIVAILCCLTAAIAAYLLYERVHTKSWQSLQLTLPTIALCLCIAAGVYGLGMHNGQRTRTDLPKAADITSVSFGSQTGSYAPFIEFIYGYEYDAMLWRDLCFDKPEVREFAARVLADTAESLSNPNIRYYNLGQRQLTLNITLRDGRTLHRTVHMTESQYELMARMLLSTPECIALLHQQPDPTRLVLQTSQFTLLDDNALQNIWTQTCTDLDAMDALALARTMFGSRLPNLMQAPRDTPAPEWTMLSALVYDGLVERSRNYNIDGNTPNAGLAVLRTVNHANGAAFLALMEEALAMTPAERDGRVSYVGTYQQAQSLSGHTLYLSVPFSGLTSWDAWYSSPSLYEEVPDRDIYERNRQLVEEEVLAILGRSTLAEGSSPYLVDAWISVTAAQPHEPSRSAFIYLTLSPDDYDRLKTLLEIDISSANAF